MRSSYVYSIFEKCVADYHIVDSVDQPLVNPFEAGNLDALLYKKSWVDTVQWHYEDLIRNPNIEPKEALVLKRSIDKSNQERTDLVEHIDSYFLAKYRDVKPLPEAGINTESPAWAIDRLSILALKIFHMNEETLRKDALYEHTQTCKAKLEVLLEQRKDLSSAIDKLLKDISEGKKYMKVYKQMKMYNDPMLNPVLYRTKK